MTFVLRQPFWASFSALQNEWTYMLLKIFNTETLKQNVRQHINPSSFQFALLMVRQMFYGQWCLFSWSVKTKGNDLLNKWRLIKLQLICNGVLRNNLIYEHFLKILMIVLSTTYAQYHKGYGQYMVFRVGSRSTSKGGQNSSSQENGSLGQGEKSKKWYFFI